MKKIRCAIYTRKSSEEGLDQEFNSLHAQREACAAYIASQKHEGWVPLPQHYDDGGISGGTLERAGLKRLLQDVDEGLVDQIVVYKIDRLTRSLSDFAKLVDRLDAADASFVSVTQSFNTATSMGRLTLNVLLSFAQFEREVTAERIRDKIAASKKKGLWMGGTIPLGYEPDGRSLKIVPEEAETVRTLFDLYLRHGSIKAVLEHADRLGLRSKARIKKPTRMRTGNVEQASVKGEAEIDERRADAVTNPDAINVEGHHRNGGNVPFERAGLHYLLTNPVYAGRIRHRALIHEGQHQAIIDPETWERVQLHLKDGAGRKRGKVGGSANASLLAGKLVDESGNRMTPSHANKKGRRYRYYVSNRMINGGGMDAGSNTSGWRLPAKPLEEQIAGAVLAHLRDRLPVDLLVSHSTDAIARLGNVLDILTAQARMKGPKVILSCMERATIKPGAVNIVLDPERIADCMEISKGELYPEVLSFITPFQFRKRGVETRLVIGTASPKAVDATLIRSIAKAHQYYEAIKQGQTFEEVAATENLSKRRILQVIDLAFLAPDIVRSMIHGDQPIGLTAKWLGLNPMPSDWQAQRRIAAAV
ncbi:MAG: resolvase [Hoeflea sp.]|uniref:recombinase family protein n=1 Tax=Hoeflea sp. TaxID=1940281 RepID=UPI000C0EAA6F|nr:recombinase family protein [Hoeflea sp.]PHR25460.1 MAG: resolvase [Hoeflea sp.]